MRITRNLRSKRGVARLIGMRLCICDEELLVGCEAVLLGCVLARSGSVVAVISRGQAGDISDVLGQGLLAVDGEIREWLVSVVLFDESPGVGFKVLEVSRLPPVAGATFGIEGRTGGVESVADLVSDDRADGAIVCCGMRLRVTETTTPKRHP